MMLDLHIFRTRHPSENRIIQKIYGNAVLLMLYYTLTLWQEALIEWLRAKYELDRMEVSGCWTYM